MQMAEKIWPLPFIVRFSDIDRSRDPASVSWLKLGPAYGQGEINYRIKCTKLQEEKDVLLCRRLTHF